MQLKNLTIMVTRPNPHGEELCQLLQAEGAETVLFPTVEIIPLNIDLSSLEHYDFVVFTSPQTVYQTQHKLTQRTKALAIGQATAKALSKAGIKVHAYPELDWSSEGLLALPILQNVQDKKIAIIRGETGRELLQEVLTKRGAKVDNMIAYRRMVPNVDAAYYRELLHAHKISIVVCTSNEILQNLVTLVGMVPPVPVMVVSQRMHDFAKKLGFSSILIAENASHDAIISELVKHKDFLCQTKKISK